MNSWRPRPVSCLLPSDHPRKDRTPLLTSFLPEKVPLFFSNLEKVSVYAFGESGSRGDPQFSQFFFLPYVAVLGVTLRCRSFMNEFLCSNTTCKFPFIRFSGKRPLDLGSRLSSPSKGVHSSLYFSLRLCRPKLGVPLLYVSIALCL